MYSEVRNKYFVLLICIFSIQCVSAQQKIFGRIVDIDRGMPVQGAYIKSIKSNSNSVSDGNGIFNIKITGENFDTLVIDALGYKQILITDKIISDSILVKLIPSSFLLPEITVSTMTNWNEFWSKISIQTNNPMPAESEVFKKVDFRINGSYQTTSQFRALSHFEGFSLDGLRSYLRGRLFWYVVQSGSAIDTTSIINYDGLLNSALFTDLDLGVYLYLLAVDTSPKGAKFGLGRNIFNGITNFGSDSVYIIDFYPVDDSVRENTIKFNRASSKFYSLFSAEKRFYIRKSDFKILRIDFKQTSKDPEPVVKENILSIREISGSIGFHYFNGNIHPAYIYQFYAYVDKNGNEIERRDSSYFSNVQNIKLTERDLKSKYQISSIYRNFPIRSASILNQKRLGHFRYVPFKK